MRSRRPTTSSRRREIAAALSLCACGSFDEPVGEGAAATAGTYRPRPTAIVGAVAP